MFNKGQFLTTEFLLGVVIFCVLLILVLTTFSDTVSIINFKNTDKKLYDFAFNASEMLVSSEGVPVNWNTIILSNVNVIGLAKTKNELDSAKVLKFIDYNSQYENVKEKLGLGAYGLYVSFVNGTNGNLIYEFGVVPSNNSNVVAITRYAVLDSNIVKVNIKVWQ